MKKEENCEFRKVPTCLIRVIVADEAPLGLMKSQDMFTMCHKVE